jgi:hypothetical protein
MAIPDTPLFVKTHDFLIWLLERTQRFPKNLRQSYTLKLESTAFDFQESTPRMGPSAASGWSAPMASSFACALCYDCRLI